MNEPELGNKVARLLNQGLDDIGQDTLNRLQAARRSSLESYQMSESRVITGGGTAAHSGHGWHFNPGKVLSLFALLLALAGVAYWQTPIQQGSDIADLDIMLLSDELPVDAYLDDEFGEWLDHSWQ